MANQVYELQSVVGKITAAFEATDRAITPLPQTTRLNSQSRFDLWRLIDRHFDNDELKTLCFALSVDYDNLEAAGKSGKIRELIEWCERNLQVAMLIEWCQQLRPEAFKNEV